MGKIIVFCRPSGAPFLGQELGHVGWAYETTPGQFLCGSVENTSGNPEMDSGKTDYWEDNTQDPYTRFAIGPLGDKTLYDVYKELYVSVPDTSAARRAMDWAKSQPYKVKGLNCMNFTYEVLKAYGANFLPNPNDMNINNWIPNLWFNSIQAQRTVLMQASYPIEVMLHEHINVDGDVKRIRENGPEIRVSNLHDEEWGDKASSIVVRSGTVTLFSDINFGGKQRDISGPLTINSLDESGLNDQVSSLIARADNTQQQGNEGDGFSRETALLFVQGKIYDGELAPQKARYYKLQVDGETELSFDVYAQNVKPDLTSILSLTALDTENGDIDHNYFDFSQYGEDFHKEQISIYLPEAGEFVFRVRNEDEENPICYKIKMK